MSGELLDATTLWKLASSTTDSQYKRFLAFLSDPGDGCILHGGSPTSGGYPRFWVSDAEGLKLAYRWIYEKVIGPIPDGFQIDHVKARGCRHRNCINPQHLEAVTARVNWERSESPSVARSLVTECINGHTFDEANTHIRTNGTRRCRTCDRDRHRRDYYKDTGLPAFPPNVPSCS